MVGFNTASIGSSAIISSATTALYCDTVKAGSKDVALVLGSPASTSTLVDADFNDYGTTEGATRVTASTGAYKTWTLNATGRGWIAKTGVTVLGWREAAKDLDNSAPTPTGNENGAQFTGNGYAGTTRDPYLNVVYKYPAGFFALL